MVSIATVYRERLGLEKWTLPYPEIADRDPPRQRKKTSQSIEFVEKNYSEAVNATKDIPGRFMQMI